MATALDLTPEQRAEYTKALRRRMTPDPATAARIERRREAAWVVARRAAADLRERFGASRVVVFGSLARGDFTLGSDVDLAAWDIEPRRYFESVAFLLDLGVDYRDSEGGFRIDVVAAEAAPSGLLASIERDSIVL